MRHPERLALLVALLVAGCSTELPITYEDAGSEVVDAGAVGTRLEELSVLPDEIEQGGSAMVSVKVVAEGDLPGAEARFEIQPPEGERFTRSVSELSFAAGETRAVELRLDGLDQLGAWTIYAGLHDSAGNLLAAGPEEGVGLTVSALSTEWRLEELSASPATVSSGAPVTLSVSVVSVSETALSGAEVWFEARDPEGRSTFEKATGISVAPGERAEASLQSVPLSVPGTWLFLATLRDSSGSVLATGPEEGASVLVTEGETSFAITGLSITPGTIEPGGSVEVQISISSVGTAALAGGKLLVDAEEPTGGEVHTQFTPDIALAAGATRTVTQLRGPYTLLGTWRFRARLQDSAGNLLASGPAAGTPMVVAAPAAGWSIPSMSVSPRTIQPGQTVAVTVNVKSTGSATISDGQVWVDSRAPDGQTFQAKTQNVQVAAGATVAVVQTRGPYNMQGVWTYTATFRDGAGALLASGPAGGATMTVAAPAISNPLSPVVGYAQINLTSTWGSCGSHSGGVGIAYLRGFSTVAEARSIENDIYYNYGGRVEGGPGRSDLSASYNRYLTARGVPYEAYLFTDSDAVLPRIQAGTPVVAHVTLWGGHYVCIYGLKSESGVWWVYFSDGANGDGVSASLPTGYLKKWRWSTFKSYLKTGYIGFRHR